MTQAAERTEKTTLLMDMSRPGRRGASLPALDVLPSSLPPIELLRKELPLPEVSEGQVVRYFTRLSQKNVSVDTTFYPLGSCTMKYNPKVNDEAARLPGFSRLHPTQPAETVQGALQLLEELQGLLQEITGMDGASLAPCAGAQGELTGMLLFRAYHASRADSRRTIILVPDSAHGTNPASAAMAGYEVRTVPTNANGDVALGALKGLLSPEVAGIMLTMPTTLGLFDPQTPEICRLAHEAGGLVYGDGANMNALLGRAKLGEMGFDVVHLNLHKTFSTPHGGGGPGAGPVCVKGFLAPFLPTPVVGRKENGSYAFLAPPRSIGRIGSFSGNFGILVRAYAYIRTLGAEGLREVSGTAVLHANYLLARLKKDYHLPYDRPCMHEVVLDATYQKRKGVKAGDIAKRLLDYGFHAPTVYFPLNVEEALMIEPTETENLETLDAFIEAMVAIAREAEEEPETVRGAPFSTPVSRLDEARAARQPDLRWTPRS